MYINTKTNAYPVSEAQIRLDNPDVSFMQVFTPPDIYKWVFPKPAPAYDAELEGVREGQPVNYEQSWVVYPLYVEYTDAEGMVHTVEEQLATARAAKLLAQRQAMVCTPWKMRAAMTAVGIRKEVELAVAGSEQDMQDAYAYAQDFKRLDPLVIALGTALGKTELFLDELFTKAMSL